MRKELIDGQALSDEDDTRLEQLWAQNEALCDRIDDEVEAEAEAKAEAAAKADAAAAASAASQQAAAVDTGGETAPSPPAADGTYSEVVCPAELPSDRGMRIALPDGQEFDVAVPEGVKAGETFVVGPFPPAA